MRVYVCPSRGVQACRQTLKHAVYSQSGGRLRKQSTGASREKKARSDPRCSIGGNEPCGRGPDGDHFQPRGPEVEPPTGNMTFYIDITCTLRYLAYQE